MITSTIDKGAENLTLDQMEEMLDQYKHDKKAWKKAMMVPQMEVAKYREAIKTADDQIKKIQELQRMAMGNQEQIDTKYYRFRIGHVNPTKSANWVLNRDEKATPKELTAKFESFDDTLIKTTHSVNETEIKNRLATGEFYVTPDGKIMDSSLKALPGYSGALKRPTVTVKAKEV